VGAVRFLLAFFFGARFALRFFFGAGLFRFAAFFLVAFRFLGFALTTRSDLMKSGAILLAVASGVA
jgi:hypothetical protein